MSLPANDYMSIIPNEDATWVAHYVLRQIFIRIASSDSDRAATWGGNAHIESFNGRERDESLNLHWVLTLDDAREAASEWCSDYNEVRPHSSVGNSKSFSRRLPD